VTWPADISVYAGLVALFLGHAWLAGTVSDAQRKHSMLLRSTAHFVAGAGDADRHNHAPLPRQRPHAPARSAGFCRTASLAAWPIASNGCRLVRVPGGSRHHRARSGSGHRRPRMVAWHLPRSTTPLSLRNPPCNRAPDVHRERRGAYWPILDATSAHSRCRMSPGAKLLYMLVATLPQDGCRPRAHLPRAFFYEYYAHAPRLFPSLTPLIDRTVAARS